MRRTRFSNCSAITFIEAMVGTAVLFIGLAACCASFDLAMRGVYTAAAQMDSLHDARKVLEYVRTLQFTNASYMVAGTYTVTNQVLLNPGDSLDPGDVGSYVVSNINNSTKLVTVNIFYYDSMLYTNNQTTLVTTLTPALHPVSH